MSAAPTDEPMKSARRVALERADDERKAARMAELRRRRAFRAYWIRVREFDGVIRVSVDVRDPDTGAHLGDVSREYPADTFASEGEAVRRCTADALIDFDHTDHAAELLGCAATERAIKRTLGGLTRDLGVTGGAR
ncbi:MAG: hypothetical protein AB7Q01_16460 [Gammaproteobacteria bacterium]